MPSRLTNPLRDISPTPQYISIIDIEGMIGGITLISDTDPNALPTSVVNTLIAEAESAVCLELSRFYSMPLVTDTGEDWTFLPDITYNTLYRLFTFKANELIIGAFVRDNIAMSDNVSSFSTYYKTKYNELIHRIFEKDRSGFYAYQLTGLMVNPELRVNRQPTGPYAIIVSAGNYSDQQNFKYALSRMQNYSRIYWSRNTK